jgi:hypothetical protein
MRNFDDIGGNLVERFDATSSYDHCDFYATTWAWTSYGKVGQVWVSGAVYLKDGKRTHATRSSEKLVLLKDLSPANAVAIHAALQEFWHDEISELQVRSNDWQAYFNFECPDAASERLRQRVAAMAVKHGGES